MGMLQPRVKQEENPFRKKRLKITMIVLSIVVSLLIVAFLVLNKKSKGEVFKPNYNICEMTQEEIVEEFKDYHFSDKQTIDDYFFYGENLSMFESTYKVEDTHKLVGKTLILKNMCNEEEFHYLVDTGVNSQIPLQHLPEGFYEVFMNVDMVRRRVVMNDVTEDSLSLVKRGEGSRHVEMIANKQAFDDKEHKNILRENYLFLNVVSEEFEGEDYDIVIDPSLGVNESGFFNNYGKNSLGMVEADELFAIAEIMKTELEKEGLKVLITRNNKDHIINAYGKDGRLEKSYDSKAKYYVELNFNTGLESGLKVTRSSYAHPGFASAIASHLLETTNLEALGDRSVYSARRYNGLDGHINIRESGGKALGAATYSELAKTSNESFAYNNRKALESISIEYLSFQNEEELERYKINKEQYAKETAQALLEYFKLGVQNDISD